METPRFDDPEDQKPSRETPEDEIARFESEGGPAPVETDHQPDQAVGPESVAPAEEAQQQ